MAQVLGDQSGLRRKNSVPSFFVNRHSSLVIRENIPELYSVRFNDCSFEQAAKQTISWFSRMTNDEKRSDSIVEPTIPANYRAGTGDYQKPGYKVGGRGAKCNGGMESSIETAAPHGSSDALGPVGAKHENGPGGVTERAVAMSVGTRAKTSGAQCDTNSFELIAQQESIAICQPHKQHKQTWHPYLVCRGKKVVQWGGGKENESQTPNRQASAKHSQPRGDSVLRNVNWTKIPAPTRGVECERKDQQERECSEPKEFESPANPSVRQTGQRKKQKTYTERHGRWGKMIEGRYSESRQEECRQFPPRIPSCKRRIGYLNVMEGGDHDT
jgi:hypothetical protein